MKQKYRTLLHYAVAIGVLILLILFFSLIRQIEGVSEYFFARGIARGYGYIVGHIAEVFPFSLFDLFVTVAIATLLVGIGFIIYYLVKKRGVKAVALLERLLITALSFALCYSVVASGNYYRSAVPLEKYEGDQLTNEETARLYGVLLDDFKKVSDGLERREDGTAVCPYTFEEINDLIRAEYGKQLTDRYFNSYVPSAKQGWYSNFLRCEGICGITFLPTGDAVINSENPPCYNVVVTAHELAHASGVMREGDANMVAYSLLINSDIPYFRYCGYMYGLSELARVLSTVDRDLYRTVYQEKYPQEAGIERSFEWEEWYAQDNFLEDIGDFFNDLYLKLNGAENGTESYSDVSSFTPVVDHKGEVVEVKVEYSDTVRVLLQIAKKLDSKDI